MTMICKEKMALLLSKIRKKTYIFFSTIENLLRAYIYSITKIVILKNIIDDIKGI